MQLVYKLFYRQFGIRRIQQLISPRLSDHINLPRNSMVHWVTNKDTDVDIDVSKLFFNQYKLIYTDYQDKIAEPVSGSPIHKHVIINSITRGFHVKNRKFKRLADAYKSVNNQLILLVRNYNYLRALYRYPNNPLSRVNEWLNIHRSMWDTINTIATESNRNHFIFINVPKDLPSISQFRTYEAKFNLTILKIFDDEDKLALLEFWKWLSLEHRENSIISKLSAENLSKVNVVFVTKAGKQCILNLGYLDSWIKDHKNLTDMLSVMQFNNLQIQKLFLKFIMVLQSSVPEESEAEVIEKADIEQHEVQTDPDDDVSESDIDDETTETEVLPTTNYLVNKKGVKEIVNLSKFNDSDIELENDEVDINKIFSDLDEDLKNLEDVNNKKLKSKGLHLQQNGELIEIGDNKKLSEEEVNEKVFNPVDTSDYLKQQINDNAEYGLITASEYKKLMSDVDNYSVMKDPYGSNETVIEKSKITQETIQVDKPAKEMVISQVVADQSMKESTLNIFDKSYIENVMQKDIISMIGAIQNSGTIIKEHEIELDNTVLGTYEIHTLKLKPIDGAESIIRIRIPKVNSDGTFTASGNKYNMRKQRVDLPIRKAGPTSVALTSYYGKTFVTCSLKKADSPIAWIIKEIEKLNLLDGGKVKKLAPADVFDNNFKAPYIYSALSNTYRLIETDELTIYLDKNERGQLFDKELYEAVEVNGAIIAGHTVNNEPLIIDRDSGFHILRNNNFISIGDIYAVFGLNELKSPVEFSEVKVFGKSISTGVILSYLIGFENLLTLLKAKYRVVEGRNQRNLQPHEYPISFADKTLIFSKKDKLVSMVIGGFVDFEKQIKSRELEEFNHRDIYFNLLESKGLTAIYIREIDLTDQLFVDPVTKSILESMHEPVTYRGLLIRASEMLLTYTHSDAQDLTQMRIRGYERISGVIYKELVTAIRQYRSKNIAGKSKIEMSPYQVWSVIMKDSANKIVEDTNPIQNLKETEIVTYAGEGGRSKETITKPMRAYHASDMGVVSEATVDSGDVGINAYLSANPDFDNVRGVIKQEKEITPTKLISTSALLAPFSNHDDGKRVNFVSIQQSHTIAAEGYHQPYVRTGYEYVIGNRTTEMFCFNAKDNGEVINLTPRVIVVKYENGEKVGVKLGRQFGKAEGSVYPHDIVPVLKIGDKFTKGDTIAYNNGFFEQDILDPKRFIMKNSMLVKTALMEGNETFEDSSSVSSSLSNKLTAKVTKVKSFIVDFNQNLLQVVKVGQKVSAKDTLMIIEDSITSTTNAFDEESLAVLKKFSNNAPKSKYEGVIDKIEIFYNGDKSDMSASLKALVDTSDKILIKTAQELGEEPVTGRVSDEYRVKGTPLVVDKAEIRFYITISTAAGVGDKAVFANQMKSVVGEVRDFKVTTNDGDEIDAIFGFKSIINRVVNSPVLMGTTATLLRVIGKKAIQLYKG